MQAKRHTAERSADNGVPGARLAERRAALAGAAAWNVSLEPVGANRFVAGPADHRAGLDHAREIKLELEKLSVRHTLDLFEGRHGGIGWRYPQSIAELVRALR